MEFVIPHNESSTSNICELEEYKQLYEQARKTFPDEYEYIIKLACINHVIINLNNNIAKQKYTSNIDIPHNEI